MSMNEQILGAMITLIMVLAATPSHIVKQLFRMAVTGGHVLRLNDSNRLVKVARFGGYEVDDTPFEKREMAGWQFSIMGALLFNGMLVAEQVWL